MWIGGSSEAAIRRTARYGTGWQSGAEAPADVGKVVAAIKKAVVEAGRTIDEDHYGAAFPFYFGTRDGVVSAAMAAYEKRTGRDPSRYFAIGDEQVVVDRVAEYVAVGVEKFILRPVGADGDEVIAQTRKLIEKVLPQVEERWPKKAKAAALKGGSDAYRRVDVLHRLFHDSRRARQGAGGARLRIGLGARALAHSADAQVAVWPGGGELPKKYYDAMDPFVTLMAAGAATTTLKVGTGVCLVNQRDPIQTAKLVASIDQLSGGRFLFGVGNGWNQDEMENHGTDFETPPQAGARAHRGDEGDLDQVQGRVSRRHGQVRSR